MFAKTFTAEFITFNGAKVPAYSIKASNHIKAAAAMIRLMEDAPAYAKANVSHILLTDSKGREYVWNVKVA